MGIICVTVLLAVTETLHLRFRFLAMKTKVELHAYANLPPSLRPGGGGGGRWRGGIDELYNKQYIANGNYTEIEFLVKDLFRCNVEIINN